MKNRVIWLYVIVTTVLILAILWSLLSGSISITFWEIATQLFSSGNENVAIIRDLRLPRIILALFAGAALSVSGLLLQAVLKKSACRCRCYWYFSGSAVVCVEFTHFFTSNVQLVTGCRFYRREYRLRVSLPI